MGTVAKNAPISARPVEAGGLGRHRQERIVGEERDDPVDVDCLPGLLEAAHHPLLGASVGGRVGAGEVRLASLSLETLACRAAARC